MNEIITRDASVIATEINTIKEHAQRVFLVSSVQIGKKLVEAKALLPHGEWGDWLKQSVDYSQRTANNLMKIYKEYNDDLQALESGDDKSQGIASLSYTQAVALLSLPSEEREEFVTENDLESMSTRDLQQAIKEKQELEKKLKKKDSELQLEQQAKEKLQEEYQAISGQAEQHEQTIEQLKSDLNEANNGGDQDEINRLASSLDNAKGDLDKSKERIKELEKQLKEKPIEVPVVVEKIPDDIQKELDMFRKQASEKEKNQNIYKLESSFEAVVSGFNELLTSLNDIEDENDVTKYKEAVKKLLSQMKENL